VEKSPLWVDSAQVEVLCGTATFVENSSLLSRPMKEISKTGMPLHFRELGDFRVPARVQLWKEAHRTGRFHDVFVLPGDYLLTFVFVIPPDASPEMHNADRIVDELVKTTQDVMLAWNVAVPGCVRLRAIHADTSEMSMSRPVRSWPQSLLQACAAAEMEGWPTVDVIPFDSVWTWLRAQAAFATGVTNSAIARAVAAFSHLLEAEGPAVQLFWALVGLEALFTEGEAGLLAQMRSRAPLIVGSAPRAHKLMGEMYQVRSKFVHGKLDFMSAHKVFEIADADSPISKELSDAVNTAVGILLASIQQLVRKNCFELRFGVTLLP
jgi:hypothetical protein